MATDCGFLADHIRDIPDFPESGVTFKDITPLLGHVDCFRFAIDALADHFSGLGIDRVVGIEARGFILGAPVAYRIGAGFVPIRKPGKLPAPTRRAAYDLEYGSDSLEVHLDGIGPGEQVVVIDDVLATGGTAAATVALVEAAGGDVAGLGFLVEIGGLSGRERLDGYDLVTLVVTEEP